MIEKDWITKAGLRAVCYLIPKRHRCGYVEVPKGHPLFGIEYSQPFAAIPKEAAENASLGKKSPILAFTASVDAGAEDKVRRSPDIVFDCHGGLTYSGNGQGKYPVDSEGWWFGFDCAHSGDAEIEQDPRWPSDGEVRSAEYVEEECERLAEQIVAMFPLDKQAA